MLLTLSFLTFYGKQQNSCNYKSDLLKIKKRKTSKTEIKKR